MFLCENGESKNIALIAKSLRSLVAQEMLPRKNYATPIHSFVENVKHPKTRLCNMYVAPDLSIPQNQQNDRQ